MKKFKKRMIALMAAFQLFVNIPVIGLLNVSAAEAFAYQDALIPIEAFATAIAIGSGIVASQSQAAVDGASEMLRKAVASMKAKACLDSDTEFRVIDGGKPRKPQKGDDKNNRKWFTIAAGSVATGSLIAGLKASREMMQSIYEQNGYDKINKITNQVPLIDVSQFMSFSYIKNQIIESHLPGAITQINNIESKLMDIKDFNLNDYIYSCSYCRPDAGKYPHLILYCILKKNIKFYEPSSYSIKNIQFKYNNSIYNGFYLDPPNIGNFVSADLVNISTSGYELQAMPYSTTGGSPNVRLYASVYNHYKYASYDEYRTVYPFGFIGGTIANYDFTNQIYNNSQTQQVNFPDWLQQSIETLNGNLNGLNLAINNLQLPQTWNDTQTNIQTGTAPANVINQYINNWSNPDQAPDPEPDPGPNPEPEPEPGPGDQPAAEAAVEESGKDLFDWAIKKVTLPDGFFDKLPFSIPYDIYLLLKSMFPSGKSARSVYSVRSSDVGDTNPNSITVLSNYDASGISTRTHSNKWIRTAPIINIDLHWKYHGVDGTEKIIDIVKKVDLSSISYFAMIIYISIYIFWFFLMLSWIMSSFKG